MAAGTGVGDAVERVNPSDEAREAREARLSALLANASAQVTGFSSWLRGRSFPAAVSETQAALAALTHLDVADQTEVMLALRSVYAKTPTQWGLFESLFKRYFLGEGKSLQERRKAEDRMGAGGVGKSCEVSEEHQVAAMTPLPGYSATIGERYALRVDTGVLKAVNGITARAVMRMPAPQSRRFKAGLRGRVDMRRTTRAAMRSAGQVLYWHWRRPAPDRPRVVLLVDVSGSMKPHAPFLTTLAWSFLQSRARAQVFLFSTQLLRVTAQLRRKGLTGLSESELGLGGLRGGTRIGACLHTLIERYPGLLDRHTVVMVASDGFDAGHSERLHSALEALRPRIARLVWVNPLLADPGYQPTATAMRLALPYLDTFADVHDVVSWRVAAEGGVLWGGVGPKGGGL